MKLAFFDTKIYDKKSFEPLAKDYGIEIKFFDSHLNEDTAPLAKGFDAVCVFVNDDLNSKTIEILVKGGVKLIALRCAGFNNVDTNFAFGKSSCLLPVRRCRARNCNASYLKQKNP